MSDFVLAKIDQARRLLAEAKTVQEAKQIADVAEAARIYAKRVEASIITVNHAAEIKIRAAKAFPDEVIAFTEAFFSGENLKANSPILHLRNFLLSGKVAYKKGPRAKIIARACCSAMMHHIEGATVVRLKQSDAGIEYFREHQEAAIERTRAIFTLPTEEAVAA